MFATAYMPSAGLNRMVFDRVYGSNKVLNSSDSDVSSSSSPVAPRHRHKHSRHHRRPGSHHHHAVDRLQQEDALMHASTHSEGCSHLHDHFTEEEIDELRPRTQSTPQRPPLLRRNSSIPENMNLNTQQPREPQAETGEDRQA